VLLQPHLALEVGEHRLDDEADRGLGHLCRRSFAEPVARGGDELDVDEPLGALELRPPKALVAEQDRLGVRLGEPEDRLLLALVGRGQLIADRHSCSIGHQDQSHAPHPFGLRGAVAVGRIAAEMAVGGTTGVIGTADQGAVGEAINSASVTFPFGPERGIESASANT
jgi:hypothetical protein